MWPIRGRVTRCTGNCDCPRTCVSRDEWLWRERRFLNVVTENVTRYVQFKIVNGIVNHFYSETTNDSSCKTIRADYRRKLIRANGNSKGILRSPSSRKRTLDYLARERGGNFSSNSFFSTEEKVEGLGSVHVRAEETMEIREHRSQQNFFGGCSPIPLSPVTLAFSSQVWIQTLCLSVPSNYRRSTNGSPIFLPEGGIKSWKSSWTELRFNRAACIYLSFSLLRGRKKGEGKREREKRRKAGGKDARVDTRGRRRWRRAMHFPRRVPAVLNNRFEGRA